jgi:hypothetical protein
MVNRVLTRSLKKQHLRAVIAEYLRIDDRVPEDKLLDIIIDALQKPTVELPLILQIHIPGTRAYKLHRTPSNELTEDDEKFNASIDDFRTLPGNGLGGL